jgi:hypothetical protein
VLLRPPPAAAVSTPTRLVYEPVDEAQRRADGDQLVRGIAAALEDGDVEAVPHFLRLLLVVDPGKAADTLEAIEMGLTIAAQTRARDRVQAAVGGA